MFRRKHDDRNLVEKHNDYLLFWQYIGTPLMAIIGAIIIIVLIVIGFRIKNSIESKKAMAEAQAEYEARVKVVEAFINKNQDAIGNIAAQWNEDNLFYIQNDNGIITIRFVGTEIFEVTHTLNSGQSKVLYHKSDYE